MKLILWDVLVCIVLKLVFGLAMFAFWSALAAALYALVIGGVAAVGALLFGSNPTSVGQAAMAWAFAIGFVIEFVWKCARGWTRFEQWRRDNPRDVWEGRLR